MNSYHAHKQHPTMAIRLSDLHKQNTQFLPKFGPREEIIYTQLRNFG